ncbi:hypothetical protein F183_A30250 [Bryobacterales bacterium F-183]|nr:hypothetical protein F183_A30250 [Bryobacterales bacterium F-183]
MRLAGRFLLWSAVCLAQPEPVQPTGVLTDSARLVDAESREAIEQYIASLRQNTGVEVAVLTIPTLNLQPIEDFANGTFRAWGIGQKASNEGVLLVIAMAERKTRIEVGYGLEPILTDGFVGSVQRSAREDLRKGRYGPAIRTMLEAMGSKILQSKGLLISNTAVAGSAGFAFGSIPWWVYICGGIFLVVGLLWPLFREVCSIWRARRAESGAQAWYRHAGGAAASTWDGGGFSSYSFSDSSSSTSSSDSSWSSSSDSSSSFSGGDSGGGGASSDW